MSRWVACAVCALWLSGCPKQADAPAASVTTKASSGAETDGSSGTGVARGATPEERATIDELSRAAEAVRQLRLRNPVQIEIENGDAIAVSLRDQIDEAEIERARIIYGSLGLLDTESDLQSMFAGVLGEQVIGYYDPEARRLVVRDSVMEALAGEPTSERTQEARLVLVHELVHALQDQRLGLGASFEDERTADGDNAFRAVVEGDATLAMLAHALRQQGIPLSAATAGIQQMGSYRDINALVRGEKLDDAPRRPPASTEQVIHPEKYFDRELPETVRVVEHPELRAEGFERIEEDTLGELELSVYLGQTQESATDEVAAAGWAGDHLVVYQRGDALAVVWWTTWDTEADAVEAFRAAKSVSPDGASFAVERSGRSVLIVRGIPPQLHRAVKNRFSDFAREVAARPAPPQVRPSPVY